MGSGPNPAQRAHEFTRLAVASGEKNPEQAVHVGDRRARGVRGMSVSRLAFEVLVRPAGVLEPRRAGSRHRVYAPLASVKPDHLAPCVDTSYRSDPERFGRPSLANQHPERAAARAHGNLRLGSRAGHRGRISRVALCGDRSCLGASTSRTWHSSAPGRVHATTASARLHDKAGNQRPPTCPG